MKKQILFTIVCMFLLTVLLLGCSTNSTRGRSAESNRVNETSAESNETPVTGFQWQMKDKKVIITKYTGKSTEVVIPQRIQGNPVTQIGPDAFRDCRLTSVVIPNTVSHIEQGAFMDNNLQEITLPDSVTNIGRRAFNNNNLAGITIPENVIDIGDTAFTDNPLKEICVKAENFWLLPMNAFNPPLFGVLPPGTYVQGDDRNWLFRDSDGTLLSLQSYYRKLIKDDPGILADLVYHAIYRWETGLFRNYASIRTDVKRRMLNGQGNTLLAEVMRRAWRWGPNYNRDVYLEQINELVTILLETGSVPQYWMLYYGYNMPDVVRMLLEHGALTNPESPEYGTPPSDYVQPESLLLSYCNRLAEMYSGRYWQNPIIAESAALLLEYGEDANYRDPNTGQTPLSAAIRDSIYEGGEMAGVLVKHVSRPLSREEYRNLIGFNREKVYRGWRSTYQERGIDREREDRLGIDALVLEDIRNDLLNPNEKDSDGKDIFDYAVEKGTAGLMEGLLPYLLRSGRIIIAANGTGMYFDAINAKNLSVAAVLSTAVNHKFTEKDPRGNEYSLEYYAYDYDTVYRSALQIPEGSLYMTGPNGTRSISESQHEIDYSPNTFYALSAYNDLSLYTVAGESINFNSLINTERERYYSESGKEKPNDFNPGWYISRIFGDILYAHNRVYYGESKNEYVLVDISGSKTAVYFIDTETIAIDSQTALYEPYTWISLLEGAMDSVIDSGKAYIVRSSGEVLIFNAGDNYLQFENSVSWRECRIPGWKGGERFFVHDDTVEAYNFSTGTARTLGKNLKIPYYHVEGRNYLYEDANGRRFIVEANSGKTYPEPDGEYHNFAIFENGYIHTDDDENFYTLCFFENGILRRKLVLSGDAVKGRSFSVYGNKIYLGMYGLAFTIDITSMRVSNAFNTLAAPRNADVYVYMFPFGADDIAYTYTVDYGK